MAIIKSILDQDLYSFTVGYLYLKKFPRAQGVYTFNDRDKTCYPIGFAEKVMNEIREMENLSLTDGEASFMKEKCYYLPDWYFTFLAGYKFNSKEVSVKQDEDGHLSIEITGYLWRTVYWEVPILAIISELYHKEIGDDTKIDEWKIITDTDEKAIKLLQNGLIFSDFGTRRRYSFTVQDLVVKTFKESYNRAKHYKVPGKFVGTSNVYLAMKYDLTPVGTMSHQVISMCGALFGYKEANYLAMEYWQDTFDADLGIFLYDTYGWDAFQRNFSKKHAKLFDGLRVDSGDNFEQADKIIGKYQSLDIDPTTKKVTFSNGLSTDEAIEIHKYVNGRLIDNYGIGTHFTCDIENVKPMNIVIKLTMARITEKSDWQAAIKMSNDKGKYTGDLNEVELCKKTLKID